MKPVVLHIRASNFFGGPEKQILGHIKANNTHTHIVLTFKEHGVDNELFTRCENNNIQVKAIATWKPYNPQILLKFVRIIRAIQPDIICTHGYKPSILCILAGLKSRIPLVMFSRGHTGENLKVRLFEKLELLSLKFADIIVPVSYGYANYLERCGVNRNRISVVQNAIDISQFEGIEISPALKRAEMGFHSGDFLIATAGRLSSEKAQDDLIIAFSKLHKNRHNMHLLILGDGPLRSFLENRVKTHKIANVHFLGFRKDINEIMSVIDLFVLPSLTEGLPNVVLEAFASKKPVVATNVGGVPELITDGISGILVEPSKPEDLSDAILKFYDDPSLCISMAEMGYKKIISDFSFKVQSSKLDNIYRKLYKNTL